MKIEWGNNNESITLFVTGSEESKALDKVCLALVERLVCDVHYYKANTGRRVLHAQNETQKLKETLKDVRSFRGWIYRTFGI